MPKFKNSGTGYTEKPQGSSEFPQQRKSPEGSSAEPDAKAPRDTKNPDHKGGPQVY